MAEPATTDRAVSFTEAMFLLFLGLRLTGHITWAWYWIAMPLLVQTVIAVGCSVFVVWLQQHRAARSSPTSEWLGASK